MEEWALSVWFSDRRVEMKDLEDMWEHCHLSKAKYATIDLGGNAKNVAEKGERSLIEKLLSNRWVSSDVV